MGRRKRRRRKGDKGGEEKGRWSAAAASPNLGKSRLFPLPSSQFLPPSQQAVPQSHSIYLRCRRRVPLLLEPSLLHSLPASFHSPVGRTDSRIERISNRPLYPNRKNMWKEEDERGRIEGKSDGHRYPVICRSTRPRHPPTRSLAHCRGATEYLVRWHARRQSRPVRQGEQGFASNEDDDDPLVGFSTFLFVIVFPRHCVRAPDADGGILLT